MAGHHGWNPRCPLASCAECRHFQCARGLKWRERPLADEWPAPCMSIAVQTPTQRRADEEGSTGPLVSVVIPCMNEAENIEACVTAALEAIVRMDVDGEVVVADNNSEDESVRLAESAGARVVIERRRGYGSAYLAYDFKEIPRFVEELDKGAEMVIGDRMDNIHPGAMPWLHQYVGNPILT